MGIQNGFSGTNVLVKVAFFIGFISLFCNWLAFTTNSWLKNEYTTSTQYFGLWRTCVAPNSDSKTTLVACNPIDGTGSIDFGVVQAFAIIGFMSQNVAFLLLCIFMFKENYMGNNEVRLGSAVLFIVATVGWVISVAVFGGTFTDNADDFNYSFGLAVVACGLDLFSGILVLAGGRGHGQGVVASR